MDKNNKKSNKSVQIIILAIAVIVVIAIVIFVITKNIKGKEQSTEQISTVEHQQINNSNKLAQIQEKIDAQQKVIDDLNNKLTPLVEERTQLEKQLIELQSPKSSTASEDTSIDTSIDTEMPQEPEMNTEE